MKLTELLVELETLMWHEGDLDVYTTYGDMDMPAEPSLRLHEEGFEEKFYPGVYLT